MANRDEPIRLDWVGQAAVLTTGDAACDATFSSEIYEATKRYTIWRKKGQDDCDMFQHEVGEKQDKGEEFGLDLWLSAKWNRKLRQINSG